MVPSQDKDALTGLGELYDLLKQYQSLLKSKDKDEPIGTELNQLREKLVRKSGEFKHLIETLTGKRHMTQLGVVFEMWAEALAVNSYSPTRHSALNFCIDATNEAIGRLGATTSLGSERRYRLTSPVFWGELFYQKALRRVWAWIKSHRKGVSWTAIVVIVITLLGTNWDLVKENIDRCFKFLGIGS